MINTICYGTDLSKSYTRKGDFPHCILLYHTWSAWTLLRWSPVGCSVLRGVISYSFPESTALFAARIMASTVFLFVLPTSVRLAVRDKYIGSEFARNNFRCGHTPDARLIEPYDHVRQHNMMIRYDQEATVRLGPERYLSRTIMNKLNQDYL